MKYEYNMERDIPEEWKHIKGFSDYMISNYGRVKSLGRTILVRRKYGTINKKISERVLQPTLNDSGYPIVSLYKDGNNSKHRCHVLVAEHFIGDRPLGMDVCHNNGDPSDPFIQNLRYGTRSDNISDSKTHGTFIVGEDRSGAVLCNDDVVQIKMELVRETSIPDLAKKYGVAETTIKSIKQGKSWAHIPNPDGWDNIKSRIVLHENDVLEIHKLLITHTVSDVASKIGCSKETIYSIKNGRSRKWNYVASML